MERVRYAIILEEKVDLLELKRQNWQYFVKKMLAIIEDPNFNIDGEEIIHNVLGNVRICETFCLNIYDFWENSIKEYILISLLYVLDSIITEMRLDRTKKVDFQTFSSQELLNILNCTISNTAYSPIKTNTSSKKEKLTQNLQTCNRIQVTLATKPGFNI